MYKLRHKPRNKYFENIETYKTNVCANPRAKFHIFYLYKTKLTNYNGLQDFNLSYLLLIFNIAI